MPPLASAPDPVALNAPLLRQLVDHPRRGSLALPVSGPEIARVKAGRAGTVQFTGGLCPLPAARSARAASGAEAWSSPGSGSRAYHWGLGALGCGAGASTYGADLSSSASSCTRLRSGQSRQLPRIAPDAATPASLPAPWGAGGGLCTSGRGRRSRAPCRACRERCS